MRTIRKTVMDPLSQSWDFFCLSIHSADQKDKGPKNENGLNRLDIWNLIYIFAVCFSRVLFLECFLVR